MKLTNNAVLLIVTVTLFGAAGKLALLSKSRLGDLAAANRRELAAQGEMARTVAIRNAVFATIPAGRVHLDKIKSVVARGSAALYNLAQANDLVVSMLSIDSASRGDIALDAMAKPVPMTGGDIRRVAVLVKMSFDNLTEVSDFVAQIPTTGGYLSGLDIKGREVTATVRFMGVQG